MGMRHLTEKSLTNAALFYLRRHAASRAQLLRVLERKARRAAKEQGVEVPRKAIDAVVSRMVTAGYVDDERLAVARTSSLRRSGRSTRLIRLKLRQKGIAPEIVEAATRCDPADEEAAAHVLARRKRLGQYGPPASRPERRLRDLAALARAGFSFALAKRVVDGG